MKRQLIQIVSVLFFISGIISDTAANEVCDDQLKAKEYYQKGAFEQAAQLWENCLKQASPGSSNQLQIMIQLIKSYQVLAYYPKAVELIHRSLLVLDNLSFREKAFFFSAAGDVYLSIGRIREAAAYFEKAEDSALQSKNPVVLASVLNNMGNLSASSGMESDALAAFQESLKLIDAVQKDLTDTSEELDQLKTSVTINLTRLLLRMEDYAAWIAMIRTSYRYLTSMEDSYDKASSLISLSLLVQQGITAAYFDTNQEDQNHIRHLAVEGLRDALTISLKFQNFRMAGYAYGYLGRLYEDERRYDEALYLTRNAVFYSQNEPEILYLWQWQLGRIYKKQGQINAAIPLYRKAVDTLNPIRTRFFKGYRSQRDIFQEKIKPVYLELTDLLLKQAESLPNDASRQEKLILARDVMEMLKTVELQEYFQDECVAERSHAKITAGQGDLILYPIIFPDRVVMLADMTSGMMQVISPVDSMTIEQTVRRFRTRLQFSTNNLFLEDSQQIYQWIIQPLEDILKGSSTDTLVFAPDGVFRMIPFSALHDGQRFLIEKYAIAVVPSLEMTEPDAKRSSQLRILLDGLSVSRHGFAALPNVGKELKDIHQVMEGKILQDEDYTVKNLKQEFNANDYAFVHIATHGVFGGSPNDTYLLTHDSRLTMDQLEQLIDQNRYRGNQVELLTLSACETAVGDERSAFGLAGIAVKAGVVSAIATLWFVDDIATSETMAEFYHLLQTSGLTKAKALQHAQKKLLSNPSYHHPAYWAPFLLIGNWR